MVKNNKVPLNSTRLDESHQRISYTDTETGISLVYMPRLLNLVEIWENLRFNLILNTCTISNVKENSLL